MGVPSGSFVPDGTSDWLGDIPVECGARSKGKVCGFEFVAFSAGGGEQAHNSMKVERMSVNRTTARRSAERGMFTQSDFNGDAANRVSSHHHSQSSMANSAIESINLMPPDSLAPARRRRA